MTTAQTTHTWHIVTKKDGRDDPCTIVDSEGRNLVDTYGWEHTPVMRNRALAEKVLAALNADEDTVRVPREAWDTLRRQVAAVRSLAELDRKDVFLAPGSKIKRVQEDRRRDLGAIVTTSMVAVDDVRTALDGTR